MATKLKKCYIPEDVILQYHLSFLPNEDKILGVMGRYMYIELNGYRDIGEPFKMEVGVSYPIGELDEHTEDVGVVLRVTIAEFQKLFRLWIMGKKKICESYGHWCGAFGNIHIEEFKIVGYVQLTRYDKSKDCEDEDFVYMEEVPMIQVTKWNEYADFEHG